MYYAQITEAGVRQQRRSLAICHALSLGPKVLDAPKILQPETVVGWHRVRRACYRASLCDEIDRAFKMYCFHIR
jgi:hypothetical protein